MKKYKKVIVKDKKLDNTTDVADFLSRIAEKIAQKKVTFVQGSGETTIDLPDRVLFKVEAKEKESRNGMSHSISFKIRWTEGQAGGMLAVK